jgi:hypothetical protein
MDHLSPFEKIFDITQSHLQILRESKDPEIYNLIEEEIENDIPKKEPKEKIKRESNYKSTKLFEGRNIIKKVKTHCLKFFYKSIKECADLKEKVSNNFRLKIHEKKNIYKIFKSDISKYRNKLLLKIPMRRIMKTFSNINISDNTFIKEDKKVIFDLLMNSQWSDILIYVKRRSKELTKFLKAKNIKASDITPKEVNEYLEYIKNGTNNYKDRINLDKSYLKLYEDIIDEHNDLKIKEENSMEKDIQHFLLNFVTF